MDAWSFDSQDPEETFAFGRALGQVVGAEGLAIALVGPLGAGKTVFVKGLAEGLGVDPRVVSSPTFVIAQQYSVSTGPTALHHVDLYRLESEDELESIGFYDMFAPGSVVAVEWADRFPDVLGREYLRVDLEGPSVAEASGQDGSSRPGRAARVLAKGKRAELVLADWANRSKRAVARGGSSTRVVEMRIGSTLLVAVGLALGSAWASDPGHASLQSCTHLRPIEADALGTRRAECVDEFSGALAAQTGIGRLLEGRPLDLNHASAPLLETLPGIGPARAGAIVASRPYASLSELEKVPGIGPKTRLRLEHWLSVDLAGGGEGAIAMESDPTRFEVSGAR